jgi:hypothetical protein
MHKCNSQMCHSSPSPPIREVETIYGTLTANSILTSCTPQVIWCGDVHSYKHSHVNWHFLCWILGYHSSDYVYLFNNCSSCVCCSHHSKLTRLSQPLVVFQVLRVNIVFFSRGWFFRSIFGGPSQGEVLSYSLLSLCLNPELGGGSIINVSVQ